MTNPNQPPDIPPPPTRRPVPTQPQPRPAPPAPAQPCRPHSPSEHSIQNEILRVFGQRPDMRIWRANCGVATMGIGPTARKIRFGLPGQADLSGVIAVAVIDEHTVGALARYPQYPARGLRLEIEVKSATGRQRPEQKAFEAMIQRFGGLYLLARNVEDVHSALEAQIDGYERNL